MLNYTDRLRDVMTMAHELGHGMHFTLSAQRQSALSFHPRHRARPRCRRRSPSW